MHQKIKSGKYCNIAIECLFSGDECLLYKRIKVFLGIMLLLTVGSLVFTLTCPGNYVRTECEILGYNPMSGTLNFINKLALGLSTTLYEFLFKNEWYVLVACIIFTILIFEKYRDNFFRFISCIPVAVVSIMGIFRETVIKLFPSLEVLANEISSNGLVNAESSGGGYIRCQYIVMGITTIMIFVEIFLLQNTIFVILKVFTILIASIAPRMAMGFSPTIFVSGNRTCSVMGYCIIAVTICTLLNSLNSNIEDKDKSILVDDIFRIVYYLLIFISVMNFGYIP